MLVKVLPMSLPVTLLVACTLAPRYETPALPVSATFPMGTVEKTLELANPNSTIDQKAHVMAADIGWRNFFPDLRLQKLIEIALVNNRDLRLSALNIEAARAQYQIQRSELLPLVRTTGQATIQHLPVDFSVETSSRINRQYSVGLGFASYELDFFGRVQNLKNQALEQYLATEDSRRSAQITLVAEVATAYMTWLADQRLLHMANEILLSQQTSYALSKRSFEVGAISGLDLSDAQTGLEIARSRLAQYTRQVDEDVNILTLLIGSELPVNLPPGRTLDNQLLLTDLPSGLPSDLLLRRPDITLAEHQLKAANANIGVARAAFFPSISLTSSAGLASASLGRLFNGRQGVWMFSPSINLPIFSRDSLIVGLDLAKLQKRIEIANYEKAIQSAFREVADALAARRTLNQQLVAQESIVKASSDVYRLSDLRYHHGVDRLLDMLVAQRRLYSAQQGLIGMRLAYWINLVGLYKALGGGWEEYTALPKNPSPH
ncbi:efflux transporter outer membrane subunit [Candidatus Pandoraea novymonadis]|uniref:Outer membrane protein OprM n=1 Tax=Candidatus Pandoraea novymonadis TaxID=1808959 RepID=A0ABX5FET5_9BURK|nr:efflux transporter outer membrane subunit [Candidatus Pandoraea novymonadis]PSB91801.1 Outer membrane protein OprM [Candidatus Pandoraea novymonadis]